MTVSRWMMSASVFPSTIMGFIGQNGAGKTTTIKALLNIIKTDGGTIKVLGMEHIAQERRVKEMIAAAFDGISFHDSFNARQLNVMFGGLYANWDRDVSFNTWNALGCR